MNGMALCAGAGGLELGLGLALGDSYRCVCYVEGEAYVAGILAARMLDGSLAPAPVWDDVRSFDGRPWRGRVDIVSAGFPCQPFSLAGGRGSTEDPRYLWDDVARVVGEVESSFVFLENVRGLLTTEFVPGDPGTKGEVFGQILADLAKLGYLGAWGCVRASDVGAPHRRDRIFILAALPHAAGDLVRYATGWRSRSNGEDSSKPRAYGPPGTAADAYRTGREGRIGEESQGREDPSERSGPAMAHADCERREAERLADVRAEAPGRSQAVRSGSAWGSWEVEPGVGRVVDGVASRVDRLRALGNGVVPKQAAVAFSQLASHLLRMTSRSL